ncbi:putative endonuclease [Mesobacillus persicus]|uniref:Putative endonuclease n=1 Tax=Mesobacillus persicus TaxID=930146 RepID=A0A1H8JNI4_9BACI|nr:GIY-YIG nuclease family protein [Mesobacillus persicus]SEN82323.1 putative endonuclease [Mesobacillus persicus]
MEKNNHYFYVLSCRDGSLYAGYTNDLEKRVKLHNEGKGAKYTRGRGPVKLVYSKAFETKSDALKAEYAFKQMPRAKKNDFLTSELGGNDATTEEF